MSLAQWLGIDLPIIQAPMAGVQGADLALAVVRAGGLGSLPAAMLGPQQLAESLARLSEQTDRPFNVNFFCHQPQPTDPVLDRQWQTRLAPYYQELEIADAMPAPALVREPFGDEAAKVLAEFRPAVVSFHFGLPKPALMAAIRSWGGRILASATTLDEALWLEAQGVDAIIAQGLEAGGHRGHFRSDDLTEQAGTFALLPQLVDAVAVPVVAAGGIADARGVAAALALGAAGVQVGTAYLLCPEATTSAVHRHALSSEAAARHTALSNVFTGRPARAIVNRVMRELGPICPAAPAFPMAAAAMGPLRAAAEGRGSGDFSPLWAGQNASHCQPVAAAEVTRQLAACAHPQPV